MTCSHDLRHSLNLYTTLQIVVDICDPDLVVDWINLSLSNILAKQPLWKAISISTMLYASINPEKTTSDTLSQLLNEYLAFSEESRVFIKTKLTQFKRRYITDELQRCGMDSAYKRAITSFEEKLADSEGRTQRAGSFDSENHSIGSPSSGKNTRAGSVDESSQYGLSDHLEFELLKNLYMDIVSVPVT